jgi:exonuclease VII large subunit
VRSAEALSEGDAVTLTFADGERKAQITDGRGAAQTQSAG